MAIEKPFWPGKEPNGYYEYLASAGFSRDILQDCCIKECEVVGISTRQSVILNYNDIDYPNIPVYIHTDKGARTRLIYDIDAINPIDYFEDSAFIFPLKAGAITNQGTSLTPLALTAVRKSDDVPLFVVGVAQNITYNAYSQKNISQPPTYSMYILVTAENNPYPYFSHKMLFDVVNNQIAQIPIYDENNLPTETLISALGHSVDSVPDEAYRSIGKFITGAVTIHEIMDYEVNLGHYLVQPSGDQWPTSLGHPYCSDPFYVQCMLEGGTYGPGWWDGEELTNTSSCFGATFADLGNYNEYNFPRYWQGNRSTYCSQPPSTGFTSGFWPQTHRLTFTSGVDVRLLVSWNLIDGADDLTPPNVHRWVASSASQEIQILTTTHEDYNLYVESPGITSMNFSDDYIGPPFRVWTALKYGFGIYCNCVTSNIWQTGALVIQYFDYVHNNEYHEFPPHPPPIILEAPISERLAVQRTHKNSFITTQSAIADAVTALVSSENPLSDEWNAFFNQYGTKVTTCYVPYDTRLYPIYNP